MKKIRYLIIVVFIISVIAVQGCNDNTESVEPAIGSEIDQLISNNPDANIDPGLTILIQYEGKTVLRKAYGLANVETGSIFLPETPCHIGSVTKQFTAMAVMMCIEKEWIDEQQLLSEYFPEYPDLWDYVTIHHLLTHQSGIPDYLNDLHYSFDGMTNDDALEYVIGNGQMNFEPGVMFSYSNTGYIILAKLVEKVSEKGFAEFCKEEIFSPLGMENTYFVDEKNRESENRAIGHTLDGEPYDYFVLTYGDAGIISTIDDMLVWDKSLNSNLLVNHETISKMMSSYADMHNGAYYGYGFIIDNFNGYDLPSHSGGLAGIFAYTGRIKEKDFYIGLFGNSPNYKLFEEIISTALEHYFPEKI